MDCVCVCVRFGWLCVVSFWCFELWIVDFMGYVFYGWNVYVCESKWIVWLVVWLGGWVVDDVLVVLLWWCVVLLCWGLLWMLFWVVSRVRDVVCVCGDWLVWCVWSILIYLWCLMSLRWLCWWGFLIICIVGWWLWCMCCWMWGMGVWSMRIVLGMLGCCDLGICSLWWRDEGFCTLRCWRMRWCVMGCSFGWICWWNIRWMCWSIKSCEWVNCGRCWRMVFVLLLLWVRRLGRRVRFGRNKRLCIIFILLCCCCCGWCKMCLKVGIVWCICCEDVWILVVVRTWTRIIRWRLVMNSVKMALWCKWWVKVWSLCLFLGVLMMNWLFSMDCLWWICERKFFKCSLIFRVVRTVSNSFEVGEVRFNIECDSLMWRCFICILYFFLFLLFVFVCLLFVFIVFVYVDATRGGMVNVFRCFVIVLLWVVFLCVVVGVLCVFVFDVSVIVMLCWSCDVWMMVLNDDVLVNFFCDVCGVI